MTRLDAEGRPLGYIPESARGRSKRDKGGKRADLREALAEPLNENWPPRKEDAPCCVAKVDDLGRPPAGFCSPGCIRRPENWRRLVRARQRRTESPVSQPTERESPE